MILENSQLITKPEEVADKFNNFFANVAENIGHDKNLPKVTHFSDTKSFVEEAINYHSEDRSVHNIKNDCSTKSFSFKPVEVSTVHQVLKSLNSKKATGADNIPAKILVMASDILAPQFTKLYNECINTGKFPNDAKSAQVTPIFKKENPLHIKNYRPVSILTSSSKVLEKIMEVQLNANWLETIYNDFLAAFRTGFSCQHVLLALCEKWRQINESKLIPGLLLADLSKAFDCLPHSLIVAKLQAYGIEEKSLVLLADYLSNRKQRVKVSGSASSWTQIMKGVPQGSIMGPIIFNIFMNDIFCAIKDGFVYNYADDNSVIVQGNSKNEVMKQPDGSKSI